MGWRQLDTSQYPLGACLQVHQYAFGRGMTLRLTVTGDSRIFRKKKLVQCLPFLLPALLANHLTHVLECLPLLVSDLLGTNPSSMASFEMLPTTS